MTIKDRLNKLDETVTQWVDKPKSQSKRDGREALVWIITTIFVIPVFALAIFLLNLIISHPILIVWLLGLAVVYLIGWIVWSLFPDKDEDED